MSALRVCRESCSRKLEQPNEERSQEARCTRWRPQDPRGQRMSIHHHLLCHSCLQRWPALQTISCNKSSKNRSKIEEKSSKDRRKIHRNRRKIVFGRVWALQAVSGTLQDALGAAFGRPRIGPRSILGRPGLVKSAQETSKSEPGAVPRRLRTVLVRCPSACRASNTVERARGTIFWRFCVFAQ